MSVLKTECESGLMPPLAAGRRSRAILGADDRRRVESSSGTFLKSASKPLETQSLQRHCVASDTLLVYVLRYVWCLLGVCWANLMQRTFVGR